MRNTFGYIQALNKTKLSEEGSFELLKRKLAESIVKGEYDYLFGEVIEMEDKEDSSMLYQVGLYRPINKLFIYKLVDSNKKQPPRNGLKYIQVKDMDKGSFEYSYTRELRNPEKYGLKFIEIDIKQ